jgi:hypothetical protein
VNIAGWILASLAFVLTGCTTTVVPPRGVHDPVRVVVLDYGYHASLAVPDDTGSIVEHAFGEWGWYVENRTGWWRVPGILFVPSQGAQGRRRLECPIDEVVAVTGAESGLAIEVERERLEAWRARMETAWAFASEERPAVLNPDHQMEFVESEDRYWVFNTCNAAVAAWLVELGCGVGGWTVGADFTLGGEPAGAWDGADTPP